MRLARIGEPGAERPGALVDGDLFVDLSDVVADFDEAFFASGQIHSLGAVIAEREAAGRLDPIGLRRIGAPLAAATPDPVHWPQLQRSCG